MAELNFREDMTIDEGALDVEFLRHPSLVRKYSEELEYCNDRLKRAEQKLKLVRSELILEAKSGEVRDLGAKPTDMVVEAYYRTHPKHIDAKEDYLDAARDAEAAYNAVFGLRVKKDILENLVKLMLANYFSAPTEPRNLSKEFARQVDGRREERDSGVKDRIREGMNRGRGESSREEEPAPAAEEPAQRTSRRRIEE